MSQLAHGPGMLTTRRLGRRLLVPACALILSSCAAVKAVGIHFLYRRAELPAAQVLHDVCYMDSTDCDTFKHRLDLYLPSTAHWPVLVFIHGGGWDTGDKSLRIGGADVYANIGRFFAGRGIGTAVINYRLQPGADWHDQMADVRQAVRWVRAHASEQGGRADAVFLMGHSAGGWLATFTALDTAATDAPRVQGVICVSGAGLDLTDSLSYTLGEKRDYYRKRFGSTGAERAWQAAASPVRRVGPHAPPFLILYAGGESRALQRQGTLLDTALRHAGVESHVVVVPGESHARMVLTLSRPDKHSADAVLDFVHSHTPPD